MNIPVTFCLILRAVYLIACCYVTLLHKFTLLLLLPCEQVCQLWMCVCCSILWCLRSTWAAEGAQVWGLHVCLCCSICAAILHCRICCQQVASQWT